MIMIEESWEIISEDISGIGVKIFLELFNVKPEAKNLFPFKDHNTEDLWSDINFRGHTVRYINITVIL